MAAERWPGVALLTLGLGACTVAPPSLEPGFAGLRLYAPAADLISAQRLDGERLSRGNDLRVPPGAHELLLRYQYDARQGGGLFGEPRRVSCLLRLRYAHFEAGRHYRLEARPLAMRAQGWLYGPDAGKPLARAEVVRCGPF